MITVKDLLNDFDNKKDRLLLRRMDSSCYEILLSYIPIRQETNFVNHIENLETTIQFILFLNPDFEGQKYTYANVIRNYDDVFKIQTLDITITRVFPSEITMYEDIFPPRIDETQLKNINRLDCKIKPFESYIL